MLLGCRRTPRQHPRQVGIALERAYEQGESIGRGRDRGRGRIAREARLCAIGHRWNDCATLSNLSIPRVFKNKATARSPIRIADMWEIIGVKSY